MPRQGNLCTEVSMVVHIKSVDYAQEISWQVDRGQQFGPYPNNKDSVRCDLPTGPDC